MILKYFYNLILIIGFFNVLIVGYLVYKNHYNNVINKAWFYLSICASIWSFFYFLTINADNKYYALVFINVVNLFGLLVVLTWFTFVILFLEKYRRYRLLIYIFWVLGLLIYISSFGDWFIVDMVPKYIFNYYVVPGFGYFIFTLFFIAVASLGLLLLYFNYKEIKGIKSNQTKYLLIASAMGFLGGGSVFTLSYDLSFPPYLLILFTTFPSMIAYAIIKYRLMGIRVIFSKIYVYTLVAAFSYTFFHFIYYIDHRYLGGVYSASSLILGVIFAIIFARIILPLINNVQKSSDVIFFKGLNPRTIIKDLTIELNSVIELKEIYQTLSRNFKKVLGTEEVRILIFKKPSRKKNKKHKSNNDICVSKNVSYNYIPLKNLSNIIKSVSNFQDIVIRDEIKNRKLLSELDRNNAKVIAPLKVQNEIIGIIILGEKINHDGYTQEDIEFLEIISTQAAVAIQNALLFQDVTDLSKNLQKKVEVQTRELREKAEHLQKLLVMRSEFLDIASHQLRTPVTVIKGALSMILEGSIKDEKKKQEFLKACFQKSIKLTDVINDILRASEMDTDKFELDLVPVDIDELIKQIYEDKKRETEEQGLKLILKMPKRKLPKVLSDKRYIEQVIVNLINNSLQYTQKGSITIQAGIDKKHVAIRVIDTGIGIPEEARAKLFQKFARAKNAVETYTDGSGLGLFIIKQVIDAHKDASISIEKTEVGKGTTFLLKLPVVR